MGTTWPRWCHSRRSSTQSWKVRQANAEQLLDAVVANFFILHVGRPEQAAAELAGLLAPGGRLALSTWDAPERARLPGVFVDAVARARLRPHIPPGPSFFHFSDEGEFRPAAGDTQF